MQIFKVSERKLQILVCDIDTIKGISEKYAEGIYFYIVSNVRFGRSLNLARCPVKDLVYLSNNPFFLSKLLV